MISTAWTTTPALVAGAFAACPAAGAATTPPAAGYAPASGTRVLSARLRALPTGMPVGAGVATDERHVQNKSTLGIHSPGRSLS